jgi:leucyl/phenylalanyl-tRNA---protein transferase
VTRSSNQRRRPVWLEPFTGPHFPDPTLYDEHGLVAVGGDLSPRYLLSAYRAGIFPWYQEPPILWWSPDPRAVIHQTSLHVSRSLSRHLRALVRDPSVSVRVTHQIGEVMHAAGAVRESTWITPGMERAYALLGRQKSALAYEVRRDGTLVGGLYGVKLGGLYAAESMFHVETDASKVALVAAVLHQFTHGTELFDVQFLTPHLASMGAYELPRSAYLHLLSNLAGNRSTSAPEEEAKTARPSDASPQEANEEANILPWVVDRLNLL